MWILFQKGVFFFTFHSTFFHGNIWENTKFSNFGGSFLSHERYKKNVVLVRKITFLIKIFILKKGPFFRASFFATRNNKKYKKYFFSRQNDIGRFAKLNRLIF